jgi:hypothetical protein
VTPRPCGSPLQKKKLPTEPGVVVHACNPSYSEGAGPEAPGNKHKTLPEK